MKSIIVKSLKILFALSIVLCGISIVNATAKAGEVNMHTINVGQGDAIVIESAGHYMLVDSGYAETTDKLLSYLESLNIPDNKIDYLVATHADHDHVGGFAAVLQNYRVDHAIISEPMKSTKAYTTFADELIKNGCTINNADENQTWTIGDALVKVIYDGTQGTTYNESSIVLKVTCDDRSILLAGDLTTTMELPLIAQKKNFKADILKVGHHGAAASTSNDFLKKVKASYAVITCDSLKELPKASVLQRLCLKDIKTYRTSDGDVLFNIKDGIISTNNKENNGYINIEHGFISMTDAKIYADPVAGKAVCPAVTFYLNGKIIPKSHYKVTYSGNTHTGVAKVTVTGTANNYVGTLSTHFSIYPRQTKIYSAKRKKKSVALHWSAQKTCSGYEIKYATNKSMTKNLKYKTVKGGTKNKITIKGLKAKNKYYFKVRAYTDMIGNGKWSSKKKVKKY